MMNSGYLRGDTAIEPLWNQWYAWTYLLFPGTAGLFTARNHISLLESYLADPQAHHAAALAPENLGRPYVECDPARRDEIRDLLARTRERCSDLITLAGAFEQLNELLQNQTDGKTLTPVYERVPGPVDGLVELVYDHLHRPHFRPIEGLFYRSSLHDESMQSVHVWPASRARRSFVFSTPRLPDEQSLTCAVPYRSKSIDMLARARHQATDIDDLAERLRVPPGSIERFRGLFTETAPLPVKFAGPGVRVRYYGHACVCVESSTTSVLLDPWIGYQYEDGYPRFSFSDLPEHIDFVLITHGHADHFVFETLLQLRHRVGTIVVPKSGGQLFDPSLRMMLRAAGFEHVVEIEAVDEIAVAGGAISAFPFLGEHGDLDIAAKATYHVRLAGCSFLFAADTNNLSPAMYRRAVAAYGTINVLFMGMECQGAPLDWLYAPFFFEEIAAEVSRSRRLDGSNADRAIALTELFEPDAVFVYAMGAEPWLRYLSAVQYSKDAVQIVESDRFIAWCREQGMISERLFSSREFLLEP